MSVRTLVEVAGFVPNDAVTPAGNPEVERVTLPVKPPRSVTEMVLLPADPCAMERLAGDAARLKSGVAVPPLLFQKFTRFAALTEPQPVARSKPTVALKPVTPGTVLLPVVQS